MHVVLCAGRGILLRLPGACLGLCLHVGRRSMQLGPLLAQGFRMLQCRCMGLGMQPHGLGLACRSVLPLLQITLYLGRARHAHMASWRMECCLPSRHRAVRQLTRGAGTVKEPVARADCLQ